VILRAPTPGKAKRLGRKWKLSPEELEDWHARRVDVMLDLIRKKVDDWGYLRQQLLFTSSGLLVEENWWHDNFWGDCLCDKCRNIEGQNWLGETWMYVRREVAAGAH
jgi:ribA/ribD-fused uncharacterized protein